MPTYLCHGFRWHRGGIRTLVVVQDLDDATPDWIVRPRTARSLLATFHELFPFLPPRDRSGAQQKPSILPGQEGFPAQLLEEFDPGRLDEVSRPHAFVADWVAEVDLSTSVGEAMEAYEKMRAGAEVVAQPTQPKKGKGNSMRRDQSSSSSYWLDLLRDQLQRDEAIGWYIVVNGDEERAWPRRPGSDEDADEERSGIREREGEEYDKEGRTRRLVATSPPQLPPLDTAGTTPTGSLLNGTSSSGWSNSSFLSPSQQAHVDPSDDDDDDNNDNDNNTDPDEQAREEQRRLLRLALAGDENILGDDDDDHEEEGDPTGSNSDGNAPRRLRHHAQTDIVQGGTLGLSEERRRKVEAQIQAQKQTQKQTEKQKQTQTQPTLPTTQQPSNERPFPPPPPPPPPSPPRKLRSKLSVDNLRPRTPSGGLRRLFGRTKEGS